MRLKLSLFFVFIITYSWSQTTTPFTTSGTFNVPAGITSITTQAWGGGGSGGGAGGAGLLAGRGAAGGGGGAYVSSLLTVTPGAALNVVVAGQTAGTTGNGTAGGSSTITGFEALFFAVGGSGGGSNNTGTAPGAAAGGTVAASAGGTRIAGGAGGAGDSAGLSLGLFSGVGGTGGNSGGAGGAANSSLILGTAPGKIGTAPGGGGSGAINSALGSPQIGGIGGAGEVLITYTCPTYNITGASATNVCISVGTTSTVTVTASAALLPVGNYVVTYNRSNPSAGGTGLTANMTVSTAGTGFFTATGLTTAGSSTITVTALTSGSCSSTVNFGATLSVSALPTITLAATAASVCSSASVQNTTLSYSATTNTPTTYSITWNASPTNTFAAVTDAALSASPITIVVPAGTVAGTYTGTLTVKTAAGCVSSPASTFTVTVNPTPTITLAAATTSVCPSASAQNTTLSYSATSGTPTTYSITWNASPTNTFAAVTDASLPASPITIVVPAGTIAGTYTGTLTVKTAAGCVSSPASTFTVTVNPTPTITLAGSAVTVCSSASAQNTTLSYSATSGTPTTYSITWNASPTNTFAAVTDAALPASPITIVVPAGTVAGTYTGTLTVKTAAGCVSSPASTFTVTVNPTPTITLAASAASVCSSVSAQNTTLSYSGITNTPTTYSIVWNGSPTNTFAAVTDASLPASPITIVVPGGTIAGTYTGTLTVKTAAGCVSSSASTFTVTVNPTPTITLAASAASVCSSVSAQNTTLSYSGITNTPTTYSIVWNGSPTNTFAAVTDASLPASPITIVVPGGTIAGTYTGTLTVKTAAGCVSSSASTFTVTVNPTPTITLAASAASVCSSVSAQNTTLSYSGITNTPTTYSIVWNGSPTNTFAAVTDASLPASPITIVVPGGTIAGTYTGTLTVKTAAGCVSSSASTFTVTVNATPTAPVIGVITPPTCAVSTGSVALSGLPSGSWSIVTNPATITTTGSGTSTVISNLAPNTYTFIVSNLTTSCTSAASLPAIVPTLVTNSWSGSGWSSGTPTANQNIIFSADYTSATGQAGDLTACSCQVNLTAKVTIKAGATLAITNSVTVASTASLKFEDKASLFQVNDNAVNSGKIIYERISAQMKDQDYVYWSSPVFGQKFSTLSLGTKSCFAFNIATNSWIYADDNMEIGRGYTIKARNSGPFPYDQKVAFEGTPNNGLLTLGTPTKFDEYILVGNPYPSALFADDFLRGNSTILEGTLYFWTHVTPLGLQGGKLNYASEDYATYNFTGGVTPGEGTGSGSGSAPPLGYIAAGQSFFVNAKIGGAQVTFNNSMRASGQNGQFYRPGKTRKATAIEKNRVWLNLTNKEGAFKQILVGYIEGATDDYESMFDGISLNGNTFINFYSVLKDKKLSIQGRAIPFKETDLVYLGYSSEIAGDFTIEIDDADGLLADHTIYLEDKVTGTIQDLRQKGYTFTTAKTDGVDNRFVLRYTNKTLGTGEFEATEDIVRIAVENKEIQINTLNQTIDAVYVYDTSGKLLYQKDKIGNPKLTIENLKLSNQVLIVKVILDNKHTETKKVIY
ncbi:T9SS sorting signal type C domain-containing protein [Flavobacterium sp. PL02]|uniref:T9SS sorting signal type C domain-containing protein n=1 Tax=Flavobacterium sp. PL02 TaxID=3088354 RepID=UPI002B233F17|nr:T9SS sorting signal type C domain-containing protein [Flavobacterium sp. PL02]MEA9415235.1 T9SS sorting signal type C domain-containing protein [Flavobacterium sp. PL02]